MTTDLMRWLWAAVAVALWLGLIGLVVARVRAAKRAEADKARALSGDAGSDAVIVAFASQTGFGEELAWMTARALTEAGTPARILPFADLGAAALKGASRALFVVSTTGEGDAPDNAARMVRRLMAAPAELSGLSYGVLALGDRTYRDFCGFGHAVERWLRASGGQPLFDTVEVDDGSAADIRHWQHNLNQLTGATAAPDWSPPAYDRWTLVERELMNPGSPGGQAWRLAFAPVDHVPSWEAGDIAEVGLPAREGQPAPGAREYSVASLPSDGRAEFLIRLMTRPDGTPGLASGWLTQTLNVGDAVDMRMRANRGFRAPPPEAPMILIGNGTGIAGLRGHLKARALQPATGGAWLLFGERTAAHDAFFDAELQAWLASGVLTRLDRAFSRDGADRRYVQHLLAEQAREIAAWIDRGAVIYVCGSLEGMSRAVHATLEAALGEDTLQTLTETGRYRRDVY